MRPMGSMAVIAEEASGEALDRSSA